MTEMEKGHFAGTEQVLDAQKQVLTERVHGSQFQKYVDLARQHAPTGKWLDIGCGGGLLVSLAQNAGYEAAGIELTADRRVAAARLTKSKIYDQPVEDLLFEDNTFDVISLINVFSHLISPSATLAELRRILKPAGVLILATGEVSAGVQKSHVLSWNLGDHLYFLGDRTMSQYAEKVGLRIAYHDRAWLPATLYTKEWLRAKGRSPLRNAFKSAVANTPGALPLLRSVMLRRQAGSAVHATVFALTSPTSR
jgi:ubiquinone/menaquinone biosynthesis C-methylase UbiE